ncbi:MAG: hypothetical protein E4H01_07345 [Lysobacterales bacterium]|nr:MAG: hypothetical protein E4H01_07345 [Xanthomonadales bacterium]
MNLTDLFNNVFAALGDEVPIQDATTDTTRKAVLARNRWPAVSDAMLRSHPWNCAIKRATLAPDVTVPDWPDNVNYFTWPNNPYCLRILEVQTAGLDFQIEGRKIITDSTELAIKFVARVPVDEFDALLFEASVDALASELALSLTRNPDFRQVLRDGVYAKDGKLQWARGIDGQEGRTRKSQNRPLIDARAQRGGSAGPKEWHNL